MQHVQHSCMVEKQLLKCWRPLLLLLVQAEKARAAEAERAAKEVERQAREAAKAAEAAEKARLKAEKDAEVGGGAVCYTAAAAALDSMPVPPSLHVTARAVVYVALHSCVAGHQRCMQL